jgi:hypothetical protein
MVLPSGNYVDASVVATYQETLTALFYDLSRDVVFVKEPSMSGCANCIWDSINNKSSNRYDLTNPFPSGTTYHKPFIDGQTCPVCYGKGKILIPQSGVQRAMIRWISRNYEYPTQYGDGGQFGNVPNADLKLKVLTSGAGNLNICKTVIVDGITCEILQTPIHRGLVTPFITAAYYKRRN